LADVNDSFRLDGDPRGGIALRVAQASFDAEPSGYHDLEIRQPAAGRKLEVRQPPGNITVRARHEIERAGFEASRVKAAVNVRGPQSLLCPHRPLLTFDHAFGLTH